MLVFLKKTRPKKTRLRTLVLAALLLSGPAQALAQNLPAGTAESTGDREPVAGDPPARIGLEEALDLALRRSPELEAARARVEEARARRLTARTYPHNPQISVSAGDRSGADASTTDRGVELTQQIEIAGQRGKRIRAAEAALAAAEAVLRRAERALAHRVELAFARALAAERRVEIARSELSLLERLLAFEERRLSAGAGTQIDLNLARAAAGRVRQRLETTRAERATARSALAEAIGADPTKALAPRGPLPRWKGDLPPLDELVERALARRADLAARRSEVQRSRRRLELERRLAVPNLRAGVFERREEGDEITGAMVSIGIPLFDRNQGGIAQADAEIDRRKADLDTSELAVRRSVADAWSRYRAARRAVAALDTLVVGTLAESLELLERALAAGKVSAGDVLVLRRELVEAERQHVDAELDLASARSDLRLAVGDPSILPLPPVPPADSPPTDSHRGNR